VKVFNPSVYFEDWQALFCICVCVCVCVESRMDRFSTKWAADSVHVCGIFF
jgi:hypothetical protein